MNKIHWDKLRILVTNKCNYRCPFCHNEGQEKNCDLDMMNYTKFTYLMDMLADQDISEINFSGGEPFFNPNIVNMIKYADSHMKCDISCATNLSLITDEQIKQLSKTRVKFNIQFPCIDELAFAKSTGNGHLKDILIQIKKIKSYGMAIGLNSVIQSDAFDIVEDLILFALNQELPLKLLPQLGLKESWKYKEYIYPILNKYAFQSIDKETGATRWSIQKNGRQTSVLYIDSPCFYKDIATCKKYGEIRIHPDFKLQPCILSQHMETLDLQKDKEHIISQFATLWNAFNHC